jgi:hypothetical protein
MSTKEQYSEAVLTATKIPINSKTDFKGWLLINHRGKFYIGYKVSDTNIGKFHKNKPAVSLLTKGIVTHYVQPLFKK